MGVVIIKNSVTQSELRVAKEEYGDFVKVVADLESGVVAIGGRWHADAEKMLIENGSNQSDLWGGGVDLASRQIDTFALINMRPGQNNPSQEILDPEIRQRFIKTVMLKFGYEK